MGEQIKITFYFWVDCSFNLKHINPSPFCLNYVSNYLSQLRVPTPLTCELGNPVYVAALFDFVISALTPDRLCVLVSHLAQIGL